MVHVFAVRIPTHDRCDRCTLAGCRYFCNIRTKCMRQRIYQPVTVTVTSSIHNRHFFMKSSNQQIQSNLSGRQKLRWFYDKYESDFFKKLCIPLLYFKIKQITEFQNPDISIRHSRVQYFYFPQTVRIDLFYDSLLQPQFHIIRGGVSTHDHQSLPILHQLSRHRNHQIICQIPVKWVTEQYALSFHQLNAALYISRINVLAAFLQRPEISAKIR